MDELFELARQLAATLAQVEHTRGTDDRDEFFCPWCEAVCGDPHHPTCARQTVLAWAKRLGVW